MTMRLYIPLVALLGLTACSPDYPFDKPGTWALGPQGSPNANDANLRAMVVNPNDLVVGQSEPGSVGAEASRPVKHLLAGKRPALPNTNTIQLQVGNDTSAQQPASSTP